MKLTDNLGLGLIQLPDDLLWVDEFDWVPLTATNSYSLTGALIIEQAVRLYGRPITLQCPDQEMAWVDRATALQLIAQANVPGKKFHLTFEYPTDTRQFTVSFDNSQKPVEVTPVKGFSNHDSQEYVCAKLNLIEVQP